MKIDFSKIKKMPNEMKEYVFSLFDSARVMYQNDEILYLNPDDSYYYIYKDRNGLTKEANDSLDYKLEDGFYVANTN